MDDQPTDKYSRFPELEDLIRLCDSLNKHQVKYLLIGGCAVILHGFPRGTKDIDLLIDPSRENIQKIKKALSYLEDNAIAEMADDEVSRYQVVRIADEFVIDLMAEACGINYEEAAPESSPKIVDGVAIPLASKKLLIRTKKTVRPSDKMDIEFLDAEVQKEKGK